MRSCPYAGTTDSQEVVRETWDWGKLSGEGQHNRRRGGGGSTEEGAVTEPEGAVEASQQRTLAQVLGDGADR